MPSIHHHFSLSLPYTHSAAVLVDIFQATEREKMLTLDELGWHLAFDVYMCEIFLDDEKKKVSLGNFLSRTFSTASMIF
jgi:hypothetical protein